MTHSVTFNYQNSFYQNSLSNYPSLPSNEESLSPSLVPANTALKNTANTFRPMTQSASLEWVVPILFGCSVILACSYALGRPINSLQSIENPSRTPKLRAHLESILSHLQPQAGQGDTNPAHSLLTQYKDAYLQSTQVPAEQVRQTFETLLETFNRSKNIPMQIEVPLQATFKHIMEQIRDLKPEPLIASAQQTQHKPLRQVLAQHADELLAFSLRRPQTSHDIGPWITTQTQRVTCAELRGVSVTQREQMLLAIWGKCEKEITKVVYREQGNSIFTNVYDYLIDDLKKLQNHSTPSTPALDMAAAQFWYTFSEQMPCTAYYRYETLLERSYDTAKPLQSLLLDMMKPDYFSSAHFEDPEDKLKAATQVLALYKRAHHTIFTAPWSPERKDYPWPHTGPLEVYNIRALENAEKNLNAYLKTIQTQS